MGHLTRLQRVYELPYFLYMRVANAPASLCICATGPSLFVNGIRTKIVYASLYNCGFCGSFVLFMSCVCHAFASLHCCLVVTWRERADPLALVCDVYCYFVTFQIGILGQMWFLIVSIPDPCCLSYFCTICMITGACIMVFERAKILYYRKNIYYL